MSLRKHTVKSIDYWLFEAGRGKTIHLGPVNDSSKIKADRVVDCLKYVSNRYGWYTGVEDNLTALLPPARRETYLQERLSSLDVYYDNLLDSLSEAGQKGYLEKRIAELQTRLRQLGLPEEEIISQDTVDAYAKMKEFTKQLVEKPRNEIGLNVKKEANRESGSPETRRHSKNRL